MVTRKHCVRAIGLMSGTSADGVDAALLETDGELDIRFVGALTIPYDQEMQGRVLEASQHDIPLADLLRLEADLTLRHAEAVHRLLRKARAKAADVEIIGFHGHTVRHLPGEGLTMQIGNSSLLAEETKIVVAGDFRRRDMAVGGQGAPLVSTFHQALFAEFEKPLLVLNLGGVGNLTWLGPGRKIVAGDTGPGCGLLDEWAQEMAGLPFDRDGELASRGRVHDDLVAEGLQAPFFAKPLPKSADRYDFDHVDVSTLSVEDGAATLCAVTAEAMWRAAQTLPAVPPRVWVAGSGVRHPVLMRMLADRFAGLQSVGEAGLRPHTLEAECFAWLAVRRLRGLPLSIPQTTGCRRAVCGGVLTA